VGELGEDETKKMFKNTRPLYMKFISAVQTLYEELIKTAYIEALRKKSLNDEYTRARKRERNDVLQEEARKRNDVLQEEARKRNDVGATKIQSVIRGKQTRKQLQSNSARNLARQSKRTTFLRIDSTHRLLRLLREFAIGKTMNKALNKALSLLNIQNGGAKKTPVKKKPVKKTPVKKKPVKKTPVKKKPVKKTPVKKKPSKKTPVKKKPVKKTPVKKK